MSYKLSTLYSQGSHLKSTMTARRSEIGPGPSATTTKDGQNAMAEAGFRAGSQRKAACQTQQSFASSILEKTGNFEAACHTFVDKVHISGTQQKLTNKFPKNSMKSKNIRSEMNVMWGKLSEYFSPLHDAGVLLPTGICSKIHVDSKRIKHIVERRSYFNERICTDPECESVTEKIFYKDCKRKPFGTSRSRGGQGFAIQFEEVLSEYVCDFAKSVKPIKKDKAKETLYIENLPNPDYRKSETYCNRCNTFIDLLESGDVTALDKYTKEDFDRVTCCLHGGQAVGRSISFYIYYLLSFYIGTKLILYNNIEEVPSLSGMYQHACDGQTFLPYHRQYLHLYGKYCSVRELLCKMAFRSIYLYVYMRRRFYPEYDFKMDFLDNGFVNLWCFEDFY